MLYQTVLLYTLSVQQKSDNTVTHISVLEIAMPLVRVAGRLIGAITIVLLSACGGDSSDPDSGASASSAAQVTLAGTVTYDRVPVTSSGLDYSSTYIQPVRGAVVHLLNSAGQVAGLNGDP